MADKFIRLLNGKLAEKEATVVSLGAADAGEIPALDSTGRLDVSVLPIGVGPDVAVILASENLSAGSYVNIYNNSGTPNARLADASNSRDAHGFVKEAVTAGNNATVYFEGPNSNLTGLVPGARYYLGTGGNPTITPPTFPASQISQFLGIAISTSAINTDIDDYVVLS
jgi:hypothetical protein